MCFSQMASENGMEYIVKELATGEGQILLVTRRPDIDNISTEIEPVKAYINIMNVTCIGDNQLYWDHIAPIQMLERTEECDIYLTHVCRHLHSIENPVKRQRSVQSELWLSSADESHSLD